jgi:hypothetical protein
MELRLKACDTAIFLDCPIKICLEGIQERCGKKRSDMPWIETEVDEEFVKFVKGFNEHQKPEIIEQLDKYNDKNIIVFKDRGQADDFLASLSEKTANAKEAI